MLMCALIVKDLCGFAALSTTAFGRLALRCAGGCGVVTASQKQGEHHHNRHQKCEFLHMYPPR